MGTEAVTTSITQVTIHLRQTGDVSVYALLFGLGVTVIIYYVVVK